MEPIVNQSSKPEGGRWWRRRWVMVPAFSVLVLVVYVLSVGPVLWLCRANTLTTPADLPIGVRMIYKPLAYAPEPLADVLDHYVKLWLLPYAESWPGNPAPFPKIWAPKYTGRILFDPPVTTEDLDTLGWQISTNSGQGSMGISTWYSTNGAGLTFAPTTNAEAVLNRVTGFEFTKTAPNKFKAKRIANPASLAVGAEAVPQPER